MTPSFVRDTIVSLLLVAAIAGCSSGAHAMAHTSPAPALRQGDSAAVARAEADSARYPYTAADVHFMQSMIAHHSQAITMAQWALTRAAHPSVRTLAERIINAQQDEIVTMRQWLTDRRQMVPDPHAASMAMPMKMDGAAHEKLMPGMLTDAQLRQLEQAKGPEFDRLFLTFMMQHHRGAVSMVQDLFGSYGAGQDETIFKFASDVNVDQSTEIARMERLLAAITSEKQAQ